MKINLLKDKDAIFSDCRKYRYVLWRIWQEAGMFSDGGVKKPYIMFIGLNPSTANELTDDPTIRRVVSMAKNWGYGGVFMTNLFGWVTPYPEELKKCSDPLGDNNDWLITISSICKDVVFAWGNFKEAELRAKEVIKMFPDAKALHINKNGSPKHPLYVKGDTQLIKFNNTAPIQRWR